jgi:hypothetical protein
MLRPTGKIVLEVIAALIAGVLVLAGIAWWQLGQGRVSDGFLKAYVEEGIARAFDAPAQIETVELRLDLVGRKLRAGVTGVAIGETDGAFRLEAPSLEAAVSLPGLFLGRVVIAEVEVEAPQIRAVLQTGGEGDEAADALPSFLRNLRQPTDERDPRRGLEKAVLKRGAATLLDQRTGRIWTLPEIDFTFTRDSEGFSGKGAVALALDTGTARADANIDSDRVAGETRVELRFADLDPKGLSHLTPQLAPLEAAALPIGGSIGFYLDRRFDLVQAELKLVGGAGSLALPRLYAEPLLVKSAALNGRLEPREQRIVLDEARIELDGPTLTLAGTVATQRNDLPFDLKVRAENIAMNDLGRFWPESANREARAWMTTNVADGVWKRADATIRGTLRDTDGEVRLDVTALDSRISFSGGTVTYMRGLPPVTGVAGEGTIGLDTVTANFTAGAIRDFRIAGGGLTITELRQRPQNMSVALEVAGPLRTALDVLAVERLRFPQKIGIEPQSVGGDAVGTLTFKFPLRKDLGIDELDLRATARVRDLSITQIMGKWPVDAGDVSLDVTQKAMKVEGSAKVSAVPADVAWTENFSAASPERSVIDLKGTLSDADRARLGIDLAPTVTGPTPLTLRYVTRKDQPASLRIDADLKPATIAVPTLRLVKPADESAQAKLEARVMRDNSLLFDKITIDGATLAASGSANFADGRIQAFDLAQVKGGENDFSARGTVAPEGAIVAEVRGEKIDLRGPEDKEKPGPRENLLPDIKMPLDLRFTVAEMRIAKTAPLRQARGAVRYDGSYYDSVSIDATAGEAPLTLRYTKRSETERDLKIETRDGGAALAALGLYENARGGELLITGSSAPSGEGRMTTGKFEFTDFKIVQAPVLAKLLNLVSPQGIAETLSGGGIGFSRGVADFQWASGVIVARDGRMSGPSLGLTFDGRIDLKQNAIDMKGTLVPIAGINNVISSVPILGALLTGGKGQGVLAATYRLDGEVTEPRPSVNPLSMLAPGFLRSLFFLGDTDYAAPVPEGPLIGPDADPALPKLN